jgi:hypothetical protein
MLFEQSSQSKSVSHLGLESVPRAKQGEYKRILKITAQFNVFCHMTLFLLLRVTWQPIGFPGLGFKKQNPPMGLLTKTRTRPWAGFLAGTHGLGRALARSRSYG